MELYMLALVWDGDVTFDWLDHNAMGKWFATTIWTYDEPPLGPPSFPCLVPRPTRDLLQAIDGLEPPGEKRIITEHIPTIFEVRHWRATAAIHRPLPCGGPFPWERVQLKIPGRWTELVLALLRAEHTVEHGSITVTPEDACRLIGDNPALPIEVMGLVSQ